MRTKTYVLTGQASSAVSIAALQASTALTPFTLAGQPAQPSEITLTSAADASTVTFIITGLDRWGSVISESIVGPNVATVRSRTVFATVTSIIPQQSTANTVSAGVPQRVCSPWVFTNPFNSADEAARNVAWAEVVSGAPTVSVEYAFISPRDFEKDAVVAATAQSITMPDAVTPVVPYQAARVVVTSATGSVRAKFLRPSF